MPKTLQIVAFLAVAARAGAASVVHHALRGVLAKKDGGTEFAACRSAKLIPRHAIWISIDRIHIVNPHVGII